MAAPAPTNIPTLSASDIQTMQQGINANNGLAGNPTAGGGAAQGQGSSYLSMIPVYLQMAQQQGGSSGSEGGGSGPGTSMDLSNDPAYQWLLGNGYLSGSADGSSISPGFRSQGITGAPVQT